MDKVFEFLLENGVLIIWSAVILVALVLAFPRWKRLYKIRVLYKKKKYSLCLIEAMNEFNNNPFPKSRTRALTYVLSCALALNEKDIFETKIGRASCRERV